MEAKYQCLKAWVEKHGGYIDSSVIFNCNDPNNRFLSVTESIEANQPIIKIPKICALTSDIVENNLYHICLKFLNELSKGEESFYYPFLQMFPGPDALKKQLPIYQEDTKKIYLQRYQKMVGQEIEDLYNNYLQESDLPDDFKTMEMAKYAIATFHSRAWQNWGYIPIIDLTQHNNHPNLRGRVQLNETLNEYMLLTGLEFEKGGSLSWEYSTENPLYLYCNYGIDFLFSLNYVKLNLHIRKDVDQLYEKKRALLEDTRFNVNNTKIIFTDKGFNFNQLPIIRILTVTNQEILDNIKQMGLEVFFNQNKMISLQNELECFKILIRLLKVELITIDLDDPLVQKKNEIVNQSIKILQQKWLSFLTDNS